MDTYYCPDCDIKLVGKEVEDTEIYCCTNCGKVFSRIGDKFRFIFQTSGNNSMRELFSFINDTESK